eukprot:358572-Chlamydomonas_euryale.AAC.1
MQRLAPDHAAPCPRQCSALPPTMQRRAPDNAVCQRIRKQWSDYQMKQCVFATSNTDMWAAARTEHPHSWWFEYCKGAMDLRAVAMRILSMPLSASSIERAWSSFESIHNRKRNCLSVSRADSLVSIFSNMKLVRNGAKQAALGKHADALPWPWMAMDGEEDIQEEEPEDIAELMDLASESDADADESGSADSDAASLSERAHLDVVLVDVAVRPYCAGVPPLLNRTNHVPYRTPYWYVPAVPCSTAKKPWQARLCVCIPIPALCVCISPPDQRYSADFPSTTASKKHATGLIARSHPTGRGAHIHTSTRQHTAQHTPLRTAARWSLAGTAPRCRCRRKRRRASARSR